MGGGGAMNAMDGGPGGGMFEMKDSEERIKERWQKGHV